VHSSNDFQNFRKEQDKIVTVFTKQKRDKGGCTVILWACID
jgi:hypothetical protein